MLKFTISSLLFILAGNGLAQTVTDVEGNEYPVVTIGQQEWMGENLRTTHFANGDEIPTVVEAVDNNPASIYQWSYNNDTSNVAEYGRLYSWYAVKDNRNVCPSGWKVPSQSDWETLSQTLGGDSIAGFSLKETGLAHWMTTEPEVTNSSGFTALPGGFRGNSFVYSNRGTTGYFWSTDQFGFDQVFQRGVLYSLQDNSSVLYSSVGLGSCGMSVRCIRDGSLQTPEMESNRWEIYPNPSNGLVSIRFTQDQTGTLVIQTMDGKSVETLPVNKLLQLNIENLPAGTYLLLLQTATSVSTKRLLVR